MTQKLPDGLYTYDRIHRYGPNTQVKVLFYDGSIAVLQEGGSGHATPERIAEAEKLIIREIWDLLNGGVVDFHALSLEPIMNLIPQRFYAHGGA